MTFETIEERLASLERRVESLELAAQPLKLYGPIQPEAQCCCARIRPGVFTGACFCPVHGKRF